MSKLIEKRSCPSLNLLFRNLRFSFKLEPNLVQLAVYLLLLYLSTANK